MHALVVFHQTAVSCGLHFQLIRTYLVGKTLFLKKIHIFDQDRAIKYDAILVPNKYTLCLTWIMLLTLSCVEPNLSCYYCIIYDIMTTSPTPTPYPHPFLTYNCRLFCYNGFIWVIHWNTMLVPSWASATSCTSQVPTTTSSGTSKAWHSDNMSIILHHTTIYFMSLHSFSTKFNVECKDAVLFNTQL